MTSLIGDLEQAGVAARATAPEPIDNAREAVTDIGPAGTAPTRELARLPRRCQRG